MLPIKDVYASLNQSSQNQTPISSFCSVLSWSLSISPESCINYSPLSRLSNVSHRHFAGSVVCMLLLRLVLGPANCHHAHTCTSICPSFRLAQVLPLDWLSACRKVNAHTSKHCGHFSPKLKRPLLVLFLCLSVTHTLIRSIKSHLYYLSVLSVGTLYDSRSNTAMMTCVPAV